MDPDPDPRRFSPAAAIEAMDPLAVEIVRRAGAWPKDGLDAMLTRASQAAFAAADGAPGAPAEIALVLTDDAEIRALNARWRGQDKPTNVLSFPLDAEDAAAGGTVALGDVVLAFETVAAEAQQRGLGIEAHAAHLAVHGVLHLLGYDHASDADATAMEALESRVLTGLGLADPYAGEAPAPGRARQESAA